MKWRDTNMAAIDIGNPLYIRIANHLRNRVMSGIYKKGEKIPGEMELCNEFNTSRVTIRQSLKVLEQQGMLIRKQGIGTLVSDKVKLQPINFNGFIEDIIFQLLPAQVVEINKSIEPVTPEIKQILQLNPEDTHIVKLQRIRAIDDQINSYALNYLPLEIGESFDENSLEEYSLIELIDMKEIVADSTQTIEAILADKAIAHKLGVDIGSAVLFSEYVMYGIQKKPVNLARVYYHAERYKYTVKMGRLNQNGI
jgi:GntR family transcriptional regulator